MKRTRASSAPPAGPLRRSRRRLASSSTGSTLASTASASTSSSALAPTPANTRIRTRTSNRSSENAITHPPVRNKYTRARTRNATTATRTRRNARSKPKPVVRHRPIPPKKLLDLPDDALALVMSHLTNLPGAINGCAPEELPDLVSFSMTCRRLNMLFYRLLHTLNFLHLDHRCDCQYECSPVLRSNAVLRLMTVAPIRIVALPNTMLTADRRLLPTVAELGKHVRSLTFEDSPVLSMRAADAVLRMPSLTRLFILSPSQRFLDDLARAQTKLTYLQVHGSLDLARVKALTRFLLGGRHALETMLLNGQDYDPGSCTEVQPTYDERTDQHAEHLEVMNSTGHALSPCAARAAFIETCVCLMGHPLVFQFKASLLKNTVWQPPCGDPSRDVHSLAGVRSRCASFAGTCALAGGSAAMLDLHVPVCRAEIKRWYGRPLGGFVTGIQPILDPRKFFCLYRSRAFSARLPPWDVQEGSYEHERTAASQPLEGRHVVAARVSEFMKAFNVLGGLSSFSELTELVISVHSKYDELDDDTDVCARFEAVLRSAKSSLRRLRVERFGRSDYERVMAEYFISMALREAEGITMLDLSSAFIVSAFVNGALERIMTGAKNVVFVHVTYEEDIPDCSEYVESFMEAIPRLLMAVGESCFLGTKVVLHLRVRGVFVVDGSLKLLLKSVDRVAARFPHLDVTSVRDELLRWEADSRRHVPIL